MATAREEIINLYDTLPARYNLGFRGIEEEPEPIAQGMFGPLHRGRWGGRGVAVKKFDLKNTDHNFDLASKEMSRMIRLRHPNVLNGFYFVGEGHVLKCSMVMELMDFDLAKYMEQRQGDGLALTDDEVVYIIAEIARGMKHVHENGYLHRDLKPQNVLMKRSVLLAGLPLDVKVADFGSSELMSGGHCDRTAGTPRYKAPEQFDRDATLRPDKMDLYSFGCLCFKLWTGKDPPLKNHAELMALWRQRCPRKLLGGVEVIIMECLDMDPDARPGFSKIGGDLDALLKERQLEQLPRREEVTHEVAVDLVTRRNEIAKELGLDGGVDGLDYADYVIPFEELEVHRRIEFNIVEVNWKGTRCALKVYSPDDTYWKKMLVADPPRVKMLPTLIHKNIVRFLGYSLTRSEQGDGMCPSIVMELFPSDLRSVIQSRRYLLNEQKRWKIMKGIAEGMKFLHGKDWVHGDLSPDNVLVSFQDQDVDADDIVVKLIDLRLRSPAEAEFTIRYASPEVLQAARDGDGGTNINVKKADVYSFAITCSDILGLDNHFGWNGGPHKYTEDVTAGMRPVLPKETSRDLQNLITRCWRLDPSERPSFGDISEFFSRPMPVPHPKRFGDGCKLM